MLCLHIWPAYFEKLYEAKNKYSLVNFVLGSIGSIVLGRYGYIQNQDSSSFIYL